MILCLMFSFFIIDLFEGDILIDEDIKNYFFGREIMLCDVVISLIYYWFGGVVFFMFDEKLG